MPQGSRAEKEWKRRAVAVAKLLGAGTRATARHIGCSERHVQRLAAEPETQFLIAEALRPFHATLDRLVAKVITVVDEALSAIEDRRGGLPRQTPRRGGLLRTAGAGIGGAAGEPGRQRPASDLGRARTALPGTTDTLLSPLLRPINRWRPDTEHLQ